VIIGPVLRTSAKQQRVASIDVPVVTVNTIEAARLHTFTALGRRQAFVLRMSLTPMLPSSQQLTTSADDTVNLLMPYVCVCIHMYHMCQRIADIPAIDA
jgi:hypothetical protein